jgi:hypothetical protein
MRFEPEPEQKTVPRSHRAARSGCLLEAEDTMSAATIAPFTPTSPADAYARVELSVRTRPESGPNHHLWRNGRLWWIAYTLIHDGWRQERVRHSLGTADVLEARHRRDAILGGFATDAERVA